MFPKAQARKRIEQEYSSNGFYLFVDADPEFFIQAVLKARHGDMIHDRKRRPCAALRTWGMEGDSNNRQRHPGFRLWLHCNGANRPKSQGYRPKAFYHQFHAARLLVEVWSR